MNAPVLYECRACHQPRVSCTRTSPHQGTGCLVALIGLVFCVALIGLPVMVYGIILMGRVREKYACGACGYRQVNE